MKQSVSWWCVANRVEPAPFFRSLREIGFAGVELLEPELFGLARDRGLTIASHRGHDSIERGLNDRGQHDRIEREILESLRLAETWGIPNLIVFSGNRRGLPDADGAEIAAEGLRRVAGAAEGAGVNLTLELLNSKVDHADYMADRTAWGVRVCDLVASPRVKLLYDIYHMQVMEGDVIRTIAAHHEHFAHYHTAGNPGRGNLDGAQELQYAPIAKAIAAAGFDGFVGHEFVPRGEVLPALEEAFRLFDV